MIEHAVQKSGAGLILVLLALAPGPAQETDDPPAADPAAKTSVAELAVGRAESGGRAVELAWVYFSENRIDADKFYRWSRRSWEADRDAATDASTRLKAAENHLDRMLKLNAKIARIRQLGFGNTLDVAEVEFYVREAYLWRGQARDAVAGR